MFRDHAPYSDDQDNERIRELCEKVCLVLGLTDFPVCGRLVNPSLPPSSMEETKSFEETREVFHQIRNQYIEALRIRLNELAGTLPATREAKRRLVDEVNETRSELGVALGFRKRPNAKPHRVYLELSHSSFQVRKSDSTRQHLYSGADFPPLEVLEIEKK